MKARKLLPMLLLKCVLVMLIAVIALSFAACGKSETPNRDDNSSIISAVADAKTLGEGSLCFDFSVVDLSGKESKFKIKTDKTTLRAALEEQNLIAGDESEYGLYVKTVNGTTLDYDSDGKYWALYIDGDYATASVDKTQVEEGKAYSFKAE